MLDNHKVKTLIRAVKIAALMKMLVIKRIIDLEVSKSKLFIRKGIRGNFKAKSTSEITVKKGTTVAIVNNSQIPLIIIKIISKIKLIRRFFEKYLINLGKSLNGDIFFIIINKLILAS